LGQKLKIVNFFTWQPGGPAAPSFLAQKREDRQDRQRFYLAILTIFKGRDPAKVNAKSQKPTYRNWRPGGIAKAFGLVVLHISGW